MTPREVSAKVEIPPVDRGALERCEDLPLLKSGESAEVRRVMLAWAKQYGECRARHDALARYLEAATSPRR